MNVNVFKSVQLNLDNFDEVSISEIRKTNADGEQYVDSEGKPFFFYWVTLWQGSNKLIACTGKEFTNLLGDAASKDDEKLGNIIIDHENEFEIAQATDEDDNPIFFKDDDGEETDEPLLKIQKAPHKISLKDLKAKRS